MKQQINFCAKLEPLKPSPKALLGIAAVSVAILIGYFAAALYLYSSGQGLQAKIVVAQNNAISSGQLIIHNGISTTCASGHR